MTAPSRATQPAPYAYSIPIGGGWGLVCAACRDSLATDPATEAQDAVADMEPIYPSDALPHLDRCDVCDRDRVGTTFLVHVA